MNMQQFIKEAEGRGMPASLSRAVIRGMGGWDSFKESAPDVSNHGASSGFGGFIYYSDTVPFTRRNLDAILVLAGYQARDFGLKSVAELIAGFNCLKDYSAFEVEEILMLPRAGHDGSTDVLNALAWYALEETCRAYTEEK